VKYFPLIGTGMSGSLGGVVASHNRGGAYFRNRAIPTDPGTAQQTSVRGIFASLAAAWSNTLTQAQRDGWDSYAAVVQFPDALGELRHITGLACYVGANTARMQYDQAFAGSLGRIDTPPTNFTRAEFTPPTFGFDATADEIDVGFTNTDDWATAVGGAMLIYCSRPTNATVNFFKGPYRLAGAILGAVTPPTSPAAITLPFAVVAGQKVFAQARVVTLDGRWGSPFRDGAIAA
jgi:hypothetical protein